MNYWNEFIKIFTDQGVSYGLAVAYAIVSILIAIMAIVALVMRIIVMIKYFSGNHTKAKSGKTSFEVAEEALKKAGLNDVKVKKANIFRAFVFGNSYSLSKKTIFLRRTIANKSTLTAVGLALQKVGIAKLVAKGDKKTIARNRLQVLSLIGPILFLPVVILGFVLDLVLFSTFGAFSIVGIAVGLFLVLSGFIATLLTLPVEKQANEMALQMIKENNILDDEEIEVVKKVFQAYIIAYVCEFILAVLRIIQLVLEIVMNVQINQNK